MATPRRPSRVLRVLCLLGCLWWLDPARTFTCLQHRVFAEWLKAQGGVVPPESWLATAMLWRAQRLELPAPLQRSLVAPFLPGGSKAGAHEEMYSLWRAAGLFDEMRQRASESKEADLAQRHDHDNFLTRWFASLKYQLKPFPAAARSPLNFAIDTYGFQMEDPSIFQLMENHTTEDEKLRAEMEELKASVPKAKVAQASTDFGKLKDHDALFVGHSNFHVQNPYQPWEDVSVAICNRFKDKCTNPLYNDIGFYHSEDVIEDLFDPEVDLSELSEQFDLIAGCHLILNDQMLLRLRKLLKPGGVIIWNTWFRHKGEYPGAPPDLPRLGFEAMKDEELPLSFVTEPFRQAGFQFRFCYTRKTESTVVPETVTVVEPVVEPVVETIAAPAAPAPADAPTVVDTTPIDVTPTRAKRKTSKKGFA